METGNEDGKRGRDKGTESWTPLTGHVIQLLRWEAKFMIARCIVAVILSAMPPLCIRIIYTQHMHVIHVI